MANIPPKYQMRMNERQRRQLKTQDFSLTNICLRIVLSSYITEGSIVTSHAL